VEYARHVLGIQDAEHEESAPDAPRLLISKLACSLVGVTERVSITPGTLAHRAYGKTEAAERFHCNYGLNPTYRHHISRGALKVAGVDAHGAVRIVELPTHRFFLATLFLPQLASRPDRPHPLIKAYLQAAQAFQALRQGQPAPA
jgi:CTP synthase (UTP-ammonia lyase)